MENSKPIKPKQNHIMHMENRRKLDISGVNDVVTFNENIVILHTTLGVLNLKGRDMKVNKLNVDDGDMSIEGEISSIIYTSKDDSSGKKRGLLEKLLK